MAFDGKLYGVWRAMRQRCENPAHVSYPWYGAMGVTVCERWKVFANFASDMGSRPQGLTIDRIDPGKGYEPSNCRWATVADQNRNRSSVIMLTFRGTTKPMACWAREVGIGTATLHYRIRKLGMSADQALTLPVDRVGTKRTLSRSKQPPQNNK